MLCPLLVQGFTNVVEKDAVLPSSIGAHCELVIALDENIHGKMLCQGNPGLRVLVEMSPDFQCLNPEIKPFEPSDQTI